jgi:hypothetical protein
MEESSMTYTMMDDDKKINRSNRKALNSGRGVDDKRGGDFFFVRKSRKKAQRGREPLVQ